jgi:hypothetical protein
VRATLPEFDRGRQSDFLPGKPPHDRISHSDCETA